MEKRKRIIEPAGDSESSGWSSEDSNASGISPMRFSPPPYSTKCSLPQDSSSSTQNEVDPVEECWKKYSSEFRNSLKKRRMSSVGKVNISCSSSVVTGDAENEESVNIEEDKEDVYDSGSRTWGLRKKSVFPFESIRNLGCFSQNFFHGASTSFQVQESADNSVNTSINAASTSQALSTPKTYLPQKKVNYCNLSESEGQVNLDLAGNDDNNDEVRVDTNVISNSGSDSDKKPENSDSNEITVDDIGKVKSVAAIPEERDLQQDMIESTSIALNQGLISLLECPVCLEYIFPPINQCKRGHLVCAHCKLRLNNCPTCRSRFTEMRNLVMEKVAEKLCYPCRNHISGCKGMYLLKEKREHEANCNFRTYKCIVSHCLWKGFLQDIMGHMVDAHKKIVVYGENHVLCIKLDTCVQFTQNWFVSVFGQVFRVNFLVSYLRSQITGCVQYLGPRKHASNFCYTFDVCSNNRRIMYSRQTHGDSGRLSNLYSAGDCFQLRTDAANYYVTDRVIKVKVNIKKACDVSEQSLQAVSSDSLLSLSES